MINKQNRLFHLLERCETYEQFEQRAISKSSWVLAPYAQDGYIVTRSWLKEFYKLNRGEN